MKTAYTVSVQWPDSPWKMTQMVYTIEEVIEYIRKYDKLESAVTIITEKYTMSNEEYEMIDLCEQNIVVQGHS